MLIRNVHRADVAAWERLRSELWPDGAESHKAEIEEFFAGTIAEPQAVLFAEDDAGTVMAFAELSLRRDIPGLEGQLTGYVEGLYVVPEFRLRGIARALLVASRVWAREQRCVAFASDRAERVVIDTTFGDTTFGKS
jgi:aminoglycoside 6'-N-acetyltransferase I